MATVGEAIAATLIAQWSGLGGAQPSPIQYLVERPEKDPNPTVADAVYVWLPLRRAFDPVDMAETYRNVTYTIRIVCHTKTSSARQLEIENEVDRILNSGTVITGATRQRVKEINDISNRSYSNLPKYISEVIVEVFTAMEVSATAYGAATATTITVDELTVNTSIAGAATIDMENTIKSSADNKGIYTGAGDDFRIYHSGTATFFDNNTGNLNIDSTGLVYLRSNGSTVGFHVDASQDCRCYGDLTISGASPSITGTNIADLLMFGAANAAWKPCALESWNPIAKGDFTNLGYWTNVDNTVCYIVYRVPLPTNKGGLKLYISGSRVSLADADAGDYMSHVKLEGEVTYGQTVLNDDTAGNTAEGLQTDTFGAIDCSSYYSTRIKIQTATTNAGDLDIQYVQVQAYYAA